MNESWIRLTSFAVEKVIHRPKAWISLILIFTLLMGIALLFLDVRTDGAALYPKAHPTIVRTLEDRTAFHDHDEVILLLRGSDSRNSLYTPDRFSQLKLLHEALEKIPGVVPHRVRSIVNILDPLPGTPLLSIPGYLDKIPADSIEFGALVRRIRSSEFVTGNFIAYDGSAATIHIPIKDTDHRLAMIETIEQCVASNPVLGFTSQLTGPVVAETLLGKRVLDDLARLIPIMALVIALLLFSGLGSIGGVLTPCVSALVVLTWTLGSMALFQVPITLVTTIVPVVLFVMTITDEIHLLDRFQRELAKNKTPRQAILHATHQVATPIVLTSVTTAAGFLSFASSSVEPVRQFGIFVSLGIILAMLLTFSLTPALTMIIPKTWFRPVAPLQWSNLMPSLVRRPITVSIPTLIACVLLLAGGSFGIAQLKIQDSWVDNFDPSSALVAGERELNNVFWGSFRFDVVLTTDEIGFFQREKGLLLLNDLTELKFPHAGGTLSQLIAYRVLADINQETTPVQMLPSGTVRRYSRQLQRIQRRIDLDQYLLGSGREARIRVVVKSANYTRTQELWDYLTRTLDTRLAGTGVSAHFSGELPASQATIQSIISNMLRSVLWTVICIASVLTIAYKSLRTTAVCMTPLLGGFILVLGVMGHADIPFGIATSTFIAITIGVAIDFGLHLVHAYRTARFADRTHNEGLQVAFEKVGSAIHLNAIVLTLGLLTLSISDLRPNRNLGLLLSFSMLACYVTTILLLPRLLQFTFKSRNTQT